MANEKYITGRPASAEQLTMPVDPGPYIGIVKGYGDDSGMNRIGVYIPALSQQRKSQEKDPTKRAEYESNVIICSLALPFYGRTNTTGNSEQAYDQTTKSYGMWLPTPDIDTQVMVVFVGGRLDSGYIISYVPDALMLHMVPGIAASPSFHPTAATKTAKMTSPQFEVPVAEYNKLAIDKFDKDTAWKNIPRPVHPLYDTLLAQGLEADYSRGISTSSAQRESPSNVFGISTPGPLDSKGPTIKQGLVQEATETGYDWPASRTSGHTFVMDDGDVGGNSQLVRLRSGSGHQILLDDSTGVIYVGNSTGSAWAELRNDGSIDVFSKKDVSIHAEGNMNLLADADFNIQAGEDVNILAGHNLKVETNPASVDGVGHAHFFINGNIKQTATGATHLKSTGHFNITVKEAISLTSTACIFVKSGGGAKFPIKLNTEAGNQAEDATKVNKHENPWVTQDGTTKRYAVDGKYQYITAMHRVPMHEPDPRSSTSKAKAPAAGTTPHIEEK